MPIEFDVLNTFEKTISEIKESDIYRIKLDELSNKLKSDSKYQRFNKDRSLTFTFLENAIESFLKFYETYNYKALDTIEVYKENLVKMKSSFLERKKGFLGFSGYSQTDDQFFKFYDEIVDSLIKKTEKFNQEINLICKDTYVQNLKRILKRVETLQDFSNHEKQFLPLINKILENINYINNEIYIANDSVINTNKSKCKEPLYIVN